MEPRDKIQREMGKFDQGWDKLREETFARQIEERFRVAMALQ